MIPVGTKVRVRPGVNFNGLIGEVVESSNPDPWLIAMGWDTLVFIAGNVNGELWFRQDELEIVAPPKINNPELWV